MVPITAPHMITSSSGPRSCMCRSSPSAWSQRRPCPHARAAALKSFLLGSPPCELTTRSASNAPTHAASRSHGAPRSPVRLQGARPPEPRPPLDRGAAAAAARRTRGSRAPQACAPRPRAWRPPPYPPRPPHPGEVSGVWPPVDLNGDHAGGRAAVAAMGRASCSPALRLPACPPLTRPVVAWFLIWLVDRPLECWAAWLLGYLAA